MDNMEREITISYQKFIETIRENIPSIKKQQREENVKIRLIDRLGNLYDELVKGDYQKNVDKLISYANVIIDSFKSINNENTNISQKIKILEQFKNLGNLDNPVAMNTYNDILNSINEIVSKKEEIVKGRDELVERLGDMENLCQSIPIDYTKIKNICSDYSIDPATRVNIVLYIIKDNAKIPVPIKKKEKQKQVEEVVTEPVQEVEETKALTAEELQKVKAAIDNLKDIYDTNINQEYSELLDKYYNLKKGLNQIELNTCYSNCDKTREEFIRDNLDAYTFAKLGDMWRIIMSIIIFRLKDSVQESITDLYKGLDKEHKNIEDFEEYIALVKEDINQLENKLKELQRQDANVEISRIIPKEEEQLAYFAHGYDKEDYIDEEVKNSESSKKKVLNRINNIIANGDQKGNQPIITVQGLENYDFPTVFAFNDPNYVNLAYVRISNSESGQPRIYVLAATKDTDSVSALREKCARLLNTELNFFKRQIDAINNNDSQELETQKEIYDSIFGTQNKTGYGTK